MRHVGNDIVDILHPHSQGKSGQARFRKRILLPEEENFLCPGQSDTMLWALWTGKEAAYKAIQKDQLDITSAPRRYKVQYDRPPAQGPTDSLPPGERRLLGTVATPRGDIKLETLITSRYVHSIATSFAPSAATRLVWRVECLPGGELSPADESPYVRLAVQRHLAQYLPGSSPPDIEVRRDQGPAGLGPPTVYLRGQLTAIDISLSHDGAFAAYAFALFP